MRIAIAVFALSSCTPPAGPIPGNDTGEAIIEGEVRITAIDPTQGPVSGGTNVTIYGEGFEGNVEVFFDSTSVPVSIFDNRTLIVTTPPVSTDMRADVTVRSDLGEFVWGNAFTYGTGGNDTAGVDTGDTDTGGTISGVGGVVQYQLTQTACASECWGLTSAIDVAASAAFHDPVSGSWTSWLPPSGTCAINPAPAAPVGSTRSVGSWVYLTSGSTSVGLRETSGSTGPQYTSNGLSEADYPRNASFDLSAPDVGLTATGVLRTPQAITSLTPAQILNDTAATAFQPAVSWAGHTFTWGPFGGSDPFVILIDGYSGTSGAYLGSILCLGPDNGAMNIPGAYLQAFPYDSLLAVGMYRYAVSSAVASDGRTIESVAQFGVLGNASFY